MLMMTSLREQNSGKTVFIQGKNHRVIELPKFAGTSKDPLVQLLWEKEPR